MPEGITPESLLNNVVEAIADGVSKKKSVSFFQEDEKSAVGAQFNRLFGRQKPIYNILGGGKSADVLLWRNKKISAGVLGAATAIWVIFEWLNYNFLSMLCFALMIGMIAQFVWSNASGLLNRTPSKVPRIVLPNELIINVAKSVGAEVNLALGYLQDVACRGNVKQFLLAVLSLWAAAIVGCWCNFLTVLYVGFVAAHTLPVLYERNEDQVDRFVNSTLDHLQHHYRKLDTGMLSRIPTGKFKGKKHE